MSEIVATPDAPKALGPYSQAVKANGFVFLSGQIPLEPGTQKFVEDGIAEQTERVLKNIEAILKAAGSGLDKVVRCVVFLKDMNDFAAMNEVYGRFFTKSFPARSTVQVARLPKEALIEIEAVATV